MRILEEIFLAIKKGEFLKAKKMAEEIDNEVERFNALGVINYYEGRKNEAKEWFEKALGIEPTYGDALFNYSKILFERGNYFESWRYLTRIGDKTWEVYDMLGDIQLKQDNPAMALFYYKKAVKLSDIPEMNRKYDMLRKHLRKNVRIAVFCLPGLERFVRTIAEVLSEIYEVKLIVTVNSKQIADAYNWADIVWIEWANELAVNITNNFPKGNKQILCRLHSYEALVNYPEKIKWDNIDTLIVVADHIRDILKRYHSDVYKKIDKKIKVIPNGVDLNKFKFKIYSPGFNIAAVAHINYKKAPEMWLQVIGLLRKVDKRYTLHIAGDFQEIRFANYFEYFIKEAKLEENVKMHGFIDNIEKFLEDKSYVLSTSIHEGHPYNIMEAMARGIKPLIHNYHGSKDQWPEDLIFNFIDEVPNLIGGDYESERYRSFIEERYSLEQQIKSISKQVEELIDDAMNSTPIKSVVPSAESGDVWDSIWKKYYRNDILSLFNSPDGKVFRSEFIDLLNQFFVLKGSRVLEVGSGSGMISVEFSKRGAWYTGIDTSQYSIELSRKIVDSFGLKNVNFEKMDGFKMTFPEKEFDIVFNLGVLEHFQDEEIINMLKEMARVGKFVVVGVPYSGSYIYKASKEISQEAGTWEYGFERDFYSLKDLFERSGLTLLHEEIIGAFSEAYHLKRLNQSLIKVRLASNLERILDGGKNIGNWLISIGTDNKKYEEIFQKLNGKNFRIKFRPTPGIAEIQHPSVSIIIPFLNAEKFIGRATENLHSLTYSNFEVVFVDDGSTDESYKRIEKLLSNERKFSYKILKSDRNEGPFLARYKGISASDGEYIVLHNIDDRLQLNGIEKLILDSENFETNSLLAVSVALMKDRKCTGDVWFINTERSTIDYLYKTLKNLSGTIHPINSVLSKDALLDSYYSLISLLGKFSEKFSVGEDVLLVYHMILDNVLEDITPVYYVFQGYETGNFSSMSKNVEKRIRYLPITISYVVVSLMKRNFMDTSTSIRIEHYIRKKARVIYGEKLGEIFWSNYLKYKEYFENVLRKH